MRILLLHPDDSPRRGPWARYKWDLLVDLGKSSESTAAAWQKELGCPALRLEQFRQREDLGCVEAILRTFRGRLLDSEGLDWWELTALLVHAELETSLLLRRVVAELPENADVFASRAGWPVNGVTTVLNRDVQDFAGGVVNKAAKKFVHYGRALRNLSFSQWADICFDKYDAEYRRRGLFARRKRPANQPVVLVPSAYTNVSRMAAAYARMLPDQQFLFVATRQSACRFEPLPNVSHVGLEAYISEGESQKEGACLLGNWQELLSEIRRNPDLQLLERLGRLDFFPLFFRRGLVWRDLWREVLMREPVCSVFCGDDSNPSTRIPVLLAKKRGLPTLDFHHGALDGRFLLKTLPSDLYLAKSEMERDYLLRVCGLPSSRIVLGAPRHEPMSCSQPLERQVSQIVLFSEPYESAGGRAEEIYRELLPPLVRLAKQSAMKLVIKLHPFESKSHRLRLVSSILNVEQRSATEVLTSPLSEDMLLKTWFGVSVESSTALDCTLQGVPCFLCAWLVLSSYGYVQQYSRFGVGSVLYSADEILSIPAILADSRRSLTRRQAIWQPIEPNQLRRYLTEKGTIVDAREERASVAT